MSNADQIEAAFGRITAAIEQYSDGFAPADVAEILRLRLTDIIVLRLNQFALRDIPHEQLYAFIASDVLTAIGDTYRGSKLEFDVMYTPKDPLWVDENRHGKPSGFFLTRKRAVVEGKELISRRDLAWSYQTIPGTIFEEVVRAVVAFVPLAVAGVLEGLR